MMGCDRCDQQTEEGGETNKPAINASRRKVDKLVRGKYQDNLATRLVEVGGCEELVGIFSNLKVGLIWVGISDYP